MREIFGVAVTYPLKMQKKIWQWAGYNSSGQDLPPPSSGLIVGMMTQTIFELFGSPFLSYMGAWVKEF